MRPLPMLAVTTGTTPGLVRSCGIRLFLASTSSVRLLFSLWAIYALLGLKIPRRLRRNTLIPLTYSFIYSRLCSIVERTHVFLWSKSDYPFIDAFQPCVHIVVEPRGDVAHLTVVVLFIESYSNYQFARRHNHEKSP